MQKTVILPALGPIALGLIGAAFGAYALQWQSVPADWPFPLAGAWISAAILLLGGAGVLWARSRVPAARVLAVFFGLWSLLHAPNLIAKPIDSASWLGICEPLAIAMGFLILSALASPEPDARLQTIGRKVFGVCCLVFGLAHFQYAAFTASMVPAWLPLPLFWAWATGAGHFAAGLAILSGIQARLGAGLLTAMFGVFVVALHIPRIIGSPTSHLEWTMGAVALTLTGAVFTVWRSLSAPAR